jgi:hypothetical protein
MILGMWLFPIIYRIVDVYNTISHPVLMGYFDNISIYHDPAMIAIHLYSSNFTFHGDSFFILHLPIS